MKVNPQLERFLTPIDEISADPANSRLHPEKNILAIMGSLQTHGQQKPVVVRDGTIVAGHGVVEAARRLGWDQVAAITFDRDEFGALSYSIADNRSGELATWDLELLCEQLDSLAERGVDIEQALAFSPGDLEELFSQLPGGGEGDQDAEIEGPEGSEEQPEASGDPDEQGDRPVASVRVVQLFLTASTFPDFQLKVSELQQAYGTGTAVETVLEAVRRERQKIPA